MEFSLSLSGGRDFETGTGEKGDPVYVLPVRRRAEGSPVLRPSVGAFQTPQRTRPKVQSSASPPEQRVPAVCGMFRTLSQNQHHAGMTHTDLCLL